jgi:predicted ATPase
MALPDVRLFGPPAFITPQGEQLLAPRRPHQLLALLACRRHGVPRAELAELFWPDRPEGAARTNLRVLLARAQAEQGGLDLQAERVRWPVVSDLARFEEACAAGRDDEAIALHAAPLLEGLEPGLPEPLLEWLERERQRLQALWRAAAQRRMTILPPAAALPLAALLERAEPGSQQAHRGLDAAAARADPDAFIGRAAEVAALVQRLSAGTRAVVVTGPGGVGKTALLRAALPHLAAALGMPAVAVALADLADPAQVPARVALALGVPLRSSGDAFAALQGLLAGRALVLGLDNAEHLPTLDAHLAALLAGCPALRLVVSSRRRLAIEATTLPIEGLPLPDPEDERDAEGAAGLAALRRFDAVRLFEARAAAAGAELEPARHRSALLAVLRASEGLPLALELAAAATRWMPLPDVAAELQRSLAALDAAAGAGALGAAMGLGACFDRSWALLDDAGRQQLSNLAWLPGAFTRAMAEQVAGVGIAALASLVDASLVRADRSGRCSLHPLLRQYVAERQPAADAAALAARHALHVDHLIAAVDVPGLARSPSTLAMLDAEAPHLRAAWAWIVAWPSPQAAACAARFARVMGGYHVARGGAQEILPFLEHAVRALAAPGRGGLAARAATLRTQAMLEYHRGALALAEAHARQALRWAGQARDPGTALSCLTVLGNALLFAGRVAAARAPFERAYRQALQRDDKALAAAAANGLGLVERAQGRYEQAIERFHESGQLAAQVGDAGGQVTALTNLGNIQTLRQQWAEARRSNEEALALAEAAGLQARRAMLCIVLGEVALAQGELDRARACIADAVAASPYSGDGSVVPTQAPLTLAAIERRAGRPHEAATALDQALQAALDSGSTTMQLSALNAAGQHLAALGAVNEALGLWSWVQAHPAATHSVQARAASELAAHGGTLAARPVGTADSADLPRWLEAVRGQLLARRRLSQP